MFKADHIQSAEPRPLNLRCPHCGHQGAFTPLPRKDITVFPRHVAQGGFQTAGMRSCPNIECRGLIFFDRLINNDGKEIRIDIYPRPNANLRRSGVPKNVNNTFNEAITCYHHQCYRASGVMLRRTVEELCIHAGANEGDVLNKMLEKLRDKHPIISSMVDVLHEVKFLGNDSAHAKLRHFDTIGEKEIDAAIQLLSVILLAAYQFEPLKDRLVSFKADK